MAGYAGVEDFPCMVEKPLGVHWFDFGSRLAELLLEIVHGVVATGNGWGVQLVSVFLDWAVRIGRAFLIGKSEIRNSRDYLNAIGPGVAQGIKWVFAMMSHTTLWQRWRGAELARASPVAGRRPDK